VPQHCDPDVLALLALGESVGSSSDVAHLADCAHCQSELDQLRAVVTASRSVEPADRPSAPPAAVWERVAEVLSGRPSKKAASNVELYGCLSIEAWLRQWLHAH